MSCSIAYLGKSDAGSHLTARARRLASSLSVRSFSCRSRSSAAHGFFLNTLLAPAVQGIGSDADKAQAESDSKRRAGRDRMRLGYYFDALLQSNTAAEDRLGSLLHLRRGMVDGVHHGQALMIPAHEPGLAHAPSNGKYA